MNELIVDRSPKSSISEAIKTIRTNLQFSSVDEAVKSIVVTSSIPGEGKSFVSANLAIAFAQNNNKVLIVDCDLRRGRQHKVFEVENDKGLSNLLIDNVSKNFKKYIKKTKVENLDILPMGIIPPNPTELLNSEKNKELHIILEKNYDFVVYDSVPTNGLPDALIMASIADKVVIVCSIKDTPLELLMNTKKSILNVNGNIAGIVVNRVPVKKNNYYYSKYYTND